jgi:hypothetical protein
MKKYIFVLVALVAAGVAWGVWSLIERHRSRRPSMPDLSTMSPELRKRFEEFYNPNEHELLHRQVFDYIEDRIDEKNDEVHLQSLQALPVELRAIWATWLVQCEVENGGLGQYFSNIHDERFHQAALTGFDTLGATTQKSLFQEGLTAFRNTMEEIGDNGSKEEYKERMGWVAMRNNHNNLDDRMLDALKEMKELRLTLIRSNPELLKKVQESSNKPPDATSQ